MTRIAAITAGLLLLLACGGANGTSTAADASAAVGQEPAAGTSAVAPVPDGCALLTPDEVRTILGTAVEGENDTQSGFDAACVWRVSDGSRMLREVGVEVGRLDAASVESEYDTFKKTMPFREEVRGIGDEAFLAGYSVAGTALVVRAETAIVFINTSVSGQDETLKTLAPKVLGRLR